MKVRKLSIILIVVTIFFISCKENQAPVCTIQSPTSGEIIEKGDVLVISINAEDLDGLISEVILYIDESENGISIDEPYNYEWNTSDVSVGNHTISAIAIDDKEAFNEDEIVVEVTVTIDIPNKIITDARDGNTYKVVGIGDQVWMAENLSYLPKVTPSSVISLTDSCYYIYDYQGDSRSAAKLTLNYQNYGVLYNWQAAINACPSGWHLPTENEWLKMETFLGGTEIAGYKLKSTEGWLEDGNGIDEYNFNAIPSGSNGSDGVFVSVGYYGYWWCADEVSSVNGMYKSIRQYNSSVRKGAYSKEGGFSVRCVQDN